MQQWLVINKKADFKAIGEKYHIDQVTARIIRNRDVVEDEDIRIFLQGDIRDLHNPHFLKDGDKLVAILVEKIQSKKSIRIIGDYDIDGVMSTYILKTALKRAGAIVSIQIPDRIHDGYGLNVNLVDKAYEDGVDTILTCDNGIAALAEIAHAKELGMTVLVTDHHEIPYEDVDGVRQYKQSTADAIVNPHQIECAYPYKYLCGAAVAWKVVCLLYEAMNIDFAEAETLLENVAFATVGDIMPLTGENRILVKEGLKRIRKTTNVGMRALIAQCGLEKEQIDAFHFGFVLGPCINASGRLDTAKRAIELFFQTDEATATVMANELVVLNMERKDLTQEGVDAAIRFYEENHCEKDKVLVIYLPEVHESIAGIIAGRIREKYYKPVFVLTKGEDGAKGSGRSIEEYSMYEEMCKCQELFTKFGGHPMAAGLSLPIENIDAFRQKINELATLTDEELTPKVRIDVPMPLDYVSMDLIRELSILAPFGKDNAKPVFADKNISVKRIMIMGKNRNVLKISLMTAGGLPATGIYFGDVEGFLNYLKEKFGQTEVDAAMRGMSNAIQLSMVYYPKINSFRGVDEIQFEIQHYQ
ncbi:MAG: single-stranded-DNA-specific exonuclease RecJ [Lachnospiraceae bacterium]|nr:single-stranded-DNA-specific exonuclease RecJ [Lachnospiraceae bacterium]